MARSTNASVRCYCALKARLTRAVRAVGGPRRRGGLEMEHQLVTVSDATVLASRAADFVAERARTSVADHGRFTFAVGGGKTRWAMFAELTRHDVPWSAVQIFQV